MDDDTLMCQSITRRIAEKYGEIESLRQENAKYRSFVDNDIDMLRLLQEELRNLD